MDRFLSHLALLAALAATATAEYSLALACGYGAYFAALLPAALDVYALAAFRAKRDVPVVVGVLIATNALAHLVSAGILSASTPLIIAVSAIAPLVLWRVEVLRADRRAIKGTESGSEGLAEPIPVLSVESPGEGHTVIQPTADTTALPAPERAPVTSASAPKGDAGAATPNAGASAALVTNARALGLHSTTPLRQMQREMRIGQKRAQQLRAALAV